MHKLTENILDKISIDYLRNQVLKNAYGNDDTVIAKLDPRVLIIWYLFFGLVPWFVNNVVFLLCMFLFVTVTTKKAKIAPLVLFLFCLGVFSQTGVSVRCRTDLRRKHGDDRPPSGHDSEGSGGISCLYHSVFRTGPGQTGERADLVRMPGTVFLQHFLCIQDPSSAYGGVPEYPPFLQAEGKSAGA